VRQFGQRFLYRNRIPFFISKSIPDFYFQIDQRFFKKIGYRFFDQIRSAISGSKSDPENYFSITITIAIRRNLVVSSHPPGLMTCRIEKPIRTNQTLIENFSSNSDFSFSIKV